MTNTFDRQHVERKNQTAVRRCFSSTFSITETWNCRGRNMIASIDNTVSHAQFA